MTNDELKIWAKLKNATPETAVVYVAAVAQAPAEAALTIGALCVEILALRQSLQNIRGHLEESIASMGVT